MPHEIVGELIGPAAEFAGEIASDEIQRRWGCKGCLTALLGLASIVMLALWALGAFSGA